jgi:hypothetical protein
MIHRPQAAAAFVVILAWFLIVRVDPVWQFRNFGMLYIADSLYHQAKGYVEHKDRTRAYRYKLDPQRRLRSYNSEQGEIVEDYVALKVYSRAADNCENCQALGKEGALAVFEAIIRRDINKQFTLLEFKPSP